MGGPGKPVEAYLDPERFEELEQAIYNVTQIIKNSSNPDLRYWLGETADAGLGGTPNVSDRFVSGFLYV